MDLENAIEKFIDYCKYERNLSINTINSYKTDLYQFQKNLKNHININIIDKNIIKKYIYNIHCIYKTMSIKRKIATLKSFFFLFRARRIYKFYSI